MSPSSRSEPSTSPDIRAIDSCVSPQTGVNQKASTIEFGGGLRVKLLCHQYVSNSTSFAGHICRWNIISSEEWIADEQIGRVTDDFLLDWFRLKQEDSSYDALRSQSFPSP